MSAETLFFQLQSGALPTELSEVVPATASFYLFSSSRFRFNSLEMRCFLETTAFATSMDKIDQFTKRNEQFLDHLWLQNTSAFAL